MTSESAGYSAEASQVCDPDFSNQSWFPFDSFFKYCHSQSPYFDDLEKSVKSLAKSLDLLEEIIRNANEILHHHVSLECNVTWDEPSRAEIIGDCAATLKECLKLVSADKALGQQSKTLQHREYLQRETERLNQIVDGHDHRLKYLLKPFEIDILCRVRTIIRQEHMRIRCERKNVLASPPQVSTALDHEHTPYSNTKGKLSTADFNIEKCQETSNSCTEYDHVKGPFFYKIEEEAKDINIGNPLGYPDLFASDGKPGVSPDGIATNEYSRNPDDVPLLGKFVADLDSELEELEDRTFIPRSATSIVNHLNNKFHFADLIDFPQDYNHNASDTLPQFCHVFVHNFEIATKTIRSGALGGDKTTPSSQYLNLMGSIWTLQKFLIKKAVSPESHWPSYIQHLEEVAIQEFYRFENELAPPNVFELSHLAERKLEAKATRDLRVLGPPIDFHYLRELIFESPLRSLPGENERTVSLYRQHGTGKRTFLVETRSASSVAIPWSKDLIKDLNAQVIDESCVFDTQSSIIRLQRVAANQRIVIETAGRKIVLSFLTMMHLLRFQQALTGYQAWNSIHRNDVPVSFETAGVEESVLEKASVQIWIPGEPDSYIVRARSHASHSAMKRRDQGLLGPSIHKSSSPWDNEKEHSLARKLNLAIFSTPLKKDSFFPVQTEENDFPTGFTDQPSAAVSEAGSYRSFATSVHSSDKMTMVSTAPSSYDNFSSVSPSKFGQPNKLGRSNKSSYSNELGRPNTLSPPTGQPQRLQDPLLVLFAESQNDDDKKAFVTIPIDEDTAINPELCACLKPGKDRMACTCTVIERKEGQLELESRRCDSEGKSGWKIDMCLTDNSHADVGRGDFKRLILRFPDPEAKARFSGNQNECRCDFTSESDVANCARAGHRGMWGGIKEFHRLQLERYHRIRHISSSRHYYEERSLDQHTKSMETQPKASADPSLLISNNLLRYMAGDRTFASFQDMVASPGPFWSLENKCSGLVDSAQWTWEIPALLRSLDEGSGLNLGNEVIVALNSLQYDANDLERSRLCALTLNEWICTRLPLFWRDFFIRFVDKLEGRLAESESGNFRVDLTSQDSSRGSWALNWIYDQSSLRLSITPTKLNKELLELIEIVGWVCRALRKPYGDGELTLTQAAYRLDKREIERSSSGQGDSKHALRPVVLFEDKKIPEGTHDCWKQLFNSCTIADCRRLEKLIMNKPLEKGKKVIGREKPFGKGLETSFDLMISLSAVEYPVVVGEGVVFVGYDVIVIPTAIDEAGTAAQFHVITTIGDQDSRDSALSGQLNPYQMDLGPRLLIKDFKQFRHMRCFLGWCESAQINLGTIELPADVGYSGCREKGESLYIDGFEPMIQLGVGANGPLSAVLGLQTNFKYTSHRRQFTPFGGFQKLLLDTAHEVAAIYDSGKRRGWLIPKLSVLLHMAQAYARSYKGTMPNGVPYVSGHIEASNLIETITPLGDQLVFSDESTGGALDAGVVNPSYPGGLVLHQLLLGLNTNLLSAVAAVQKSAGKKLYGFEFMDVVTTPGRGTCMKVVTLASTGRRWIDLVNQVDAVIVCSDIGQVITPAAELARRNQCCNCLPTGRDYLAAMLPCLRRLARRRGDDAFLSSSAMETIIDFNSRGKDTFKGQPSTSSLVQGMKITEDSFWYVQGDPFHGCQHDVESDDTCWNREGFLQHLKSQSYFSRGLSIVKQQNEPRCSSTCTVPLEGAVVFG